jgi:hypothetical protein
VNTEVGVKEMVHRIFKNIVPNTNRKNIELDLLKRYTTLQSIRYLADGGIDARYSQSSIGFINISRGTNHLFKDWFVTKGSLELELEESEGNFILFLNILYMIY